MKLQIGLVKEGEDNTLQSLVGAKDILVDFNNSVMINIRINGACQSVLYKSFWSIILDRETSSEESESKLKFRKSKYMTEQGIFEVSIDDVIVKEAPCYHKGATTIEHYGLEMDVKVSDGLVEMPCIQIGYTINDGPVHCYDTIFKNTTDCEPL